MKNVSHKVENKFEKLLEPGRIGKLELRNRIVMAPMGTCLGGANGEVTRRLINWYVERARGGAGLVSLEDTLVTPPEKYGLEVSGQLRIHDHKFIPGYSELTEAIHEYGAKTSLQINYPGAGTDPNLVPGAQAITASSFTFAGLYGPVVTREATLEEIHELIEAYAAGALRAKIAGFDAIELLAYTSGIAGFLSPYTNHRTDLYGGDFDGRMRFGLEIVGQIRQRLGDDFPLIVRIPADEFVPGGITLEESKKIAKKFEEAGVHAISVCSGTFGTPLSLAFGAGWLPYQKRGFLESYAAEIKKEIDIPVMVVGGLHFPEVAERILKEGKADFIVMGRGLIADPELPKKLEEGRPEDIRRCIRCNELCVSRVISYQPIRCSLNVEAGREGEHRLGQAAKRKRVLVVGGGPAGMEAARVAALRGHDVILYEKSDRLGGNLIPGSMPDFKEELSYLIEWFLRQLTKLGVKIELKKEVTPEVVLKEIKPDVAIIATGAVPLVPELPGIEKAVGAVDLLLGKGEVGDKVVMVGGGLVGCETALHLAQKGKEVTIVEMLSDILVGINLIAKYGLIEKLTETGVKWLTGLKLVEVTEDGAVAMDKNWDRKSFPGDVVLALGLKPTLLKDLEGKVSDIYTIGDCVDPRKIWNAIHEGFLTAYRI